MVNPGHSPYPAKPPLDGPAARLPQCGRSAPRLHQEQQARGRSYRHHSRSIGALSAIAQVEFKQTVTGTMTLSPSEVTLAAGGTVKLPDNTTVHLDPSSSIRVIGDVKIEIPQPSND